MRLEGGTRNEVHLVDGVVHRSGGAQSATVLAVLRHLEAEGFDGAQRVVEPGFDERGHEMLTYVEGAIQQPEPWSDEGLAAYGLVDRAGFVDRMIEVAIHDARFEAILGKVGPGTTSGIDENGFPVAWAITWRARAASWMLRNRSLLEAAL